MTLIDFLLLLLVAGVVGALGQALAGYTLGGCLMSILVGFIGAFIGRWLSVSMGLPELLMINVGTTSFPIVWSVLGGAIFVAIIALLRRPNYA